MLRREEPIPALSAGLSHVVLTGLLMLVAIPVLQRDAHVGPDRTPTRPMDSETAPPASQSAATTAPASPQAAQETDAVQEVKDEWPAEEVARGREQCMHLLSGLAAEFDMLDPIKKGPCGSPAPVMLKSVGSDPKVVFDPPVHVNCPMVAALDRWVKETLQPKARERMKSEVVRIAGASGYSCRNIYNLPNAKLSQHALANAIDIGAFGFANGRTVRVLKGWGLTGRDVKALKEKAKAEAAAKAKLVRQKGGDGKEQTVADAELEEGGKADKTEKKVNSIKQASLTPAALPLQKASAGNDPASQLTKPPTKEALFLRSIHGGACGEFGTVLGPEANDPHRNHFHLDLIPRRGRGYCQ